MSLLGACTAGSMLTLNESPSEKEGKFATTATCRWF